MKAFAIVPIKRLDMAKTRLSKILNDEERVKLTLAMLKDVLKAIRDSDIEQTYLIGANRKVAEIAKGGSNIFLWDGGEGLDKAVELANEICCSDGAEATIFVPSDLPLLTSCDLNNILELIHKGIQVVITPSKNLGTNILARKPPTVIPTSFGEKSFRKHIKLSRERDVKYEIYKSRNVLLDVDSINDLLYVLKTDKNLETKRFLENIRITDRIKTESILF